MMQSPPSKLFLLLAAALVAGLALSPSAGAQTAAETRALYDRIDRLQRDLTNMQQQLNASPRGVVGGGPVGGAAIEPGLAAQFDVRLSALEEQIRQLTGRLEESNNGLSQVRQRLDRLVGDMDFRLQQLERPGAPVSSAGGGLTADAPPGSSLAALPPGALPPAGAPAALPPGAAPPPGTLAPRNLGTVNPRDVPPPPSAAALAAASATAAPAAGSSAKTQFDYAFDMTKKQDYPAAEAGFKRLLKEHPKDPLADNAEFWLGQIYFVQKNYADAAAQFLSAYKRNPKGAKAPDDLVNLGRSLSALGKKAEACAAFGAFSKEFPAANATLKRSANEEKQRLSCG